MEANRREGAGDAGARVAADAATARERSMVATTSNGPHKNEASGLRRTVRLKQEAAARGRGRTVGGGKMQEEKTVELHAWPARRRGVGGGCFHGPFSPVHKRGIGFG